MNERIDPQMIPAMELGQGLSELGKGPISTVPFVSDSFFESEKAIWKDTWLMLGRVHDLDQEGKFLTFDLKVLSVSVAVTRDRETQLRAFYNVCPHRGGRLLRERQGQVSAIVCPFHAWTFQLDGKLRGFPEKQLFEELGEKENYCLKSVSVDTWGGFIFVNLNPEPKHSLAEYFAGAPKNLKEYLEDPSWCWHTGYQKSFQANWKDLMNIQHEGYHASYVHKTTLGLRFREEHARVTAFPESAGLSSLLSVYAPMSSIKEQAEPTTVRRLSMQYGTTSNWVGADTSSAAGRFPGAVNHSNADNWIFDCYTLFPNLILFVGSDVLSVMRVFPLNAHEADWEWDWFFKDKFENFGHLFNREHGRMETRDALTEDWPICEDVHRNMLSGVFENIFIGSDMEASVRAHYEKLLSHMNLKEEQLNDFRA